MINRDEILDMCEALQVQAPHVQRDYVFGWVLAGIYTVSELRNVLVLKGGNCLRKAYFDSARYSGDLDFAATSAIDPEFIATELRRVCMFVTENAGVVFEAERTRVQEKRRIAGTRELAIYEGRLYFKDFFGQPSTLVISVRLDITQFGKIFLPVQTRNIVHPYSDQAICQANVHCLKLEEMLASKLKCLLQRRHSADLYDFVYATFVRPQIDVNRTEVVSTFLKMTIFGSGPGIVRDILTNLPFHFIRALWDEYLVCPKESRIEFDLAVQSFRTLVDQLFGDMPRRHSEAAFYPWQLRNVILEAGHTMTLLRIVYDGIEREVEPYSLAYKIRKDGVGQEYLYVYDRTGGRSSGPGIKSLLHSGITRIANTDISFDPRFEVELSRAGEYGKELYFQGRPGLRRLRAFSLAQYVVECPVCGKHFYRKTYSLKLNPHKDRYGNRCYGRSGYVVYG